MMVAFGLGWLGLLAAMLAIAYAVFVRRGQHHR
jgi:hypothetical protein